MRWLCGLMAVCFVAWTEIGVVQAQSAQCGPGLACPAKTKCSSSGKCIPADAVECPGGKYCPRGQFCTRDGFCFQPTVVIKDGCLPNEDRSSTGRCMPKGHVDCGNGTYCSPGYRCNPGGTVACLGEPAAGPPCAGSRCAVGELCMPHGRSCYDPANYKVCPSGRLCNVLLECTPTGCQSPGIRSAQRDGRPPIRVAASARRGNPEACAHMATSIDRAKRAQSNLEASRFNANKSVRLEMCGLADATADELVNISGADCPQRLPELRSMLSALAKHKCSATEKAYYRYCQGSATSYCWKDPAGKTRCNQCISDSPPRG